ncbi:MAG: LD-carboxypeptidase [Candidatus Nomurabacteria bacterium]|jgi:muramoyltetrapeptide carboxypeptidase LdcA involved in peptidoglycan recycling|nr:LD-carboxypeptidase [Candidatus Nomurabacteria bacterium]
MTYKTLQFGDEIRVVAPSISWLETRKRLADYARAQTRLESLGYKVSFGDNIKQVYQQGTAPAQARADDLNAALADRRVRAILAVTGGWSANEVLPRVDWAAARKDPKPLIGFSDITVLLNAFYAKAGAVQFLGPNFSTLGKMTEWRYTLENFQAALSGRSVELVRSQRWSDHARKIHAGKTWRVLQSGAASARLLGGNLGTFYLLQGTRYCPKFDSPFIFAMEDDAEAGSLTGREVARRFESLLQLPNFRDNLRGLIVGRFETASKVSTKEISEIIRSKDLPKDLPIALGIDFGHTLPILTLPIGGVVKLEVGRRIKIAI